jgi:hypothetical protein
MTAALTACVFAVLGIFTIGPLFVPIALLFAVIAVLSGLARCNLLVLFTGVVALGLSGFAVMTSPTLLIMGAALITLATHAVGVAG